MQPKLYDSFHHLTQKALSFNYVAICLLKEMIIEFILVYE